MLVISDAGLELSSRTENLPLDCGDGFGAQGIKLSHGGRDDATQKASRLNSIYQDQPDNLAEVHAASHVLQGLKVGSRVILSKLAVPSSQR